MNKYINLRPHYTAILIYHGSAPRNPYTREFDAVQPSKPCASAIRHLRLGINIVEKANLAQFEPACGIAGINRPRFEIAKRASSRPEDCAFADGDPGADESLSRDPGCGPTGPFRAEANRCRLRFVKGCERTWRRCGPR